MSKYLSSPEFLSQTSHRKLAFTFDWWFNSLHILRITAKNTLKNFGTTSHRRRFDYWHINGIGVIHRLFANNNQLISRNFLCALYTWSLYHLLQLKCSEKSVQVDWCRLELDWGSGFFLVFSFILRILFLLTLFIYTIWRYWSQNLKID